MPDNPRIEELRRRVDKDPASIAFAQLAEEHRRAGDFEEAIRVCRVGLEQHPGYLSARVTLGRALLEIGQFDGAEAELNHVVRAAPDNLAAIRALADIHQRRDEGGPGPQSEARVPDQPLADSALPDMDRAFGDAAKPLAQALETLDADQVPNLEPLIPDPESLIPDPALAELEGWLDAIHADREQRHHQ